MADLERPQDASSSSTSVNTLGSPVESNIDLEKAETIHPTSTFATGAGATRSQTVGRVRSVATDGYSVYDVEEDETDQDSAERIKTTPYEVRWDGPGDKENPRNFNVARKWIIVLITSVASLCVTFTSSVYTTTYGQLMKEFHCSREIATLGLSLFVVGLAFGPMLLGPLSEFYGRRPIYIVSMFFFLIWIIPCAVAQNIQTMIVCRFFDGFAGSAFLAVAAGTVADLFEPKDIEFPMMIFTASPFLGPALGPIIGGLINQFTTWRWTFYMLLIWTGVLLVLVIFFVPETYHKVLLKKRAQQKRKDTGDSQWYAPIEKLDRSILGTVIHSCSVPFELLFFEPMCLLLCIYAAILLGIVYLFFGAFPLVFGNNHGFSLYQVGLTFTGLLVGITIGVLTDPFWHKNYVKLVKKLEEQTGQVGIKPEPEYRLPPAMFGGILVPIGLFWFGWTTYSSVHWIVPIIGSAVFGIGLFLAFTGILTFLVDAYPGFAASAVAANCLVRLLFAGAFPLFGTQMYQNLNYQWASSLLGFLALACVPLPFFFYRYGKKIRSRSRFNNSA
ncbi:hypothetical protein AYO20_07771 [Fonsecaea nubica]|uniref:Major facilitator superfamily (MFS) profile domain-containing protein n=1 Tax=Fonsecaea nubica TaxID=856822 RepID=A0A178CU81_9EURO|nr:hypothetical protein AYO20_07771 [Fonsecaea nubica]OAL32814.1 hypothetical protein AYO20_07771 [Fonsecaea nubica]